MTEKSTKKELNTLLENLRLGQTIEDMQAEVDGRTQEPSKVSVERAKLRVLSELKKFSGGQELTTQSASRESVIERISAGSPVTGAGKRRSLSRLPKILKNLSGGIVGAPAGAFASSEKGGSNQGGDDYDRIWKQDDLLLKLKSFGKKTLQVSLEIEGSWEVEPAFLSWVDETILDDAQEGTPVFVSFPIGQASDGSFLVEVPSGAYVRRMRLIDALDDGRMDTSFEPGMLLPFVEFGE